MVAVVLAGVVWGCDAIAPPAGPPYPYFVAMRQGSSWLLPVPATAVRGSTVVPQDLVRFDTDSLGVAALTGRRRGFGTWTPLSSAYHPVYVAVIDSVSGEPLLVGHAGLKLAAPENTIAGVAAACSLGLRGVEVDVRFTRDSVPVLLHDENVSRTSNGSGNVQAMTLAELRQLDFGSWFAARFRGERLPTLTEFLAAAADCGFERIQLDIKSFQPLSVDSGWDRVAGAVELAGLSAQVEFGGPDLYVIARGRRRTPNLRTVLFALEITPQVAAVIINAGISSVGVEYQGYLRSTSALQTLAAAGIELQVYGPPDVAALDGLIPRPRVFITDWDWNTPD
jgi:glycerophosphoryl diester phosphodiesterase